MKLLKEQILRLKFKYIFIIYFLIFCFAIGPVFAYSFFMKFSSQAPFGNWSQPWEDACEETSIVMIDSYYNHQDLNTEIARYKILNLLGVKNKFIGKSYDENADTIARLINNYLNWEATVVENPTLDQIRAELDANQPIILPADGLILNNPNFTSPLDYHVIVISGYDDEKQEFITQDPGTRNGHNYRYSYQVIMDAMHDFLPNNKTFFAPKVLVFTSPHITSSGQTDGDKDGLIKLEELKYHTSLVESDTDKDGYSDGAEIASGFSPHIAEYKIKDGDLLRNGKNSKVYFLQEGKIYHILSSQSFARRGYNWSDVKTVSEKFINSFPLGGTLD